MGERLTLSLTAAQVDALPEGTPITVIWSGGNGPHDYWLHRDALGVYADLRLESLPSTYNPLTFVGTERFHTRVWLRACRPPRKGHTMSAPNPILSAEEWEEAMTNAYSTGPWQDPQRFAARQRLECHDLALRAERDAAERERDIERMNVQQRENALDDMDARLDAALTALRGLYTALERSAPADPGHGEIEYRKQAMAAARAVLETTQ